MEEDAKKNKSGGGTIDQVKVQNEKKEFFRKQKQRMSQQFQEVVKGREEVVKKEGSVALKEKELQSKIKLSMEAHVKETAPDRGKEQREQKQINDFLAQEDVQSVFYRYEQSLKQMFRFYSSQDKKDVGFNLEKSLNAMTMRELIRFGYQQHIIPNLVQPEDIVQIFRYLMREKNENMQSQLTDRGDDNYLGDKNFAQLIDYEQFKKFLVRIATLSATEQLGLGTINDKLDKETASKKIAKKSESGVKNEDTKAIEITAKEETQSPLKRRVASLGGQGISSLRSKSSLKGTLGK